PRPAPARLFPPHELRALLMVATFSFRRIALLLALSTFASAAPLSASPPVTPEGRAAVVGKPVALQIQPAAITLKGPRSVQQVFAPGKSADGTVRDLTPFVNMTLEQPGIVDASEGFFRPVKNGQTSLVVGAGGLSAKAPISVAELDKPAPVSFRQQVIA